MNLITNQVTVVPQQVGDGYQIVPFISSWISVASLLYDIIFEWVRYAEVLEKARKGFVNIINRIFR